MPSKKPARRHKRRTKNPSSPSIPPSPLSALPGLIENALTSALDLLIDRMFDGVLGDGPRPPKAPPKLKTKADGPNHNPSPKSSIPVRSLYDDLEVSPHASPETITAAWKSLSKRFHPDNRMTGNEDKAKAINAAHDILSDPLKRKMYDRVTGLGVQK